MTSIHFFTLDTTLLDVVDKPEFDGSVHVPQSLVGAFNDAKNALRLATEALVEYAVERGHPLPYPYNEQANQSAVPTLPDADKPPWVHGDEIFMISDNESGDAEDYVFLRIGDASPELVTRKSAHDYIQRLPVHARYEIWNRDYVRPADDAAAAYDDGGFVSLSGAAMDETDDAPIPAGLTFEQRLGHMTRDELNQVADEYSVDTTNKTNAELLQNIINATFAYRDTQTTVIDPEPVVAIPAVRPPVPAAVAALEAMKETVPVVEDTASRKTRRRKASGNVSKGMDKVGGFFDRSED